VRAWSITCLKIAVIGRVMRPELGGRLPVSNGGIPPLMGLPGQSRAEHQPREEQGFVRVQTQTGPDGDQRGQRHALIAPAGHPDYRQRDRRPQVRP
jgi:hypothetical protein